MDILLRTLILGAMTGSVYALASTGLVLTYKTSGVLNFGYGSVAVFTTFIHWQLMEWGLPVLASAALVILIVAPLLGFFLDSALFSRLQGQPMVISLIATAGLTVLLQGIVQAIWKGETKSVPSLFPSGTFELPGGINIGYNDLAVFLVAAGAAGLLGLMLRRTRAGVAFRAVVDNRQVAGLMAINTRLVSGGAWALGTSFAALSGILLTPQLSLDPNFLPFFLVAQVLGAAVVGYLRSLPLAFAGGIAIGVIQGLIIQYLRLGGVWGNLRFAVPFVFIAVAMMVAPRRERQADLSFVVRARRLEGVASARARTTTGIAFFALMAAMPLLTGGSPSWMLALTRGAQVSIVFLSLVVLTGYSGQISLGHTAFMGIAAFATAHLVEGGMNIWLAAAIGASAAIPAGALIGVIAVRLHGLFLALMTLAAAFMAQELFFQDVTVSRGISGIVVPRPDGFTGDTAFYLFVLGVLGVLVAVALNLRNGRTGRVLAAMRDSETASRSLGIKVVRYKVVIFALSAFIAGVGGILQGMTVGSVGQVTFIPFWSLFFTALAVLGGIFHVGGALTVGMLFGFYQQVFQNVQFMLDIQFILFGLGATFGLAENAEGTFGQLRRLAHAVMRFGRRTAAPVPVSGGQR